MLSGDCRGATHYVRTIMVGAYGLDAMGSASVGGAVGVGDVGAGGDHKEQVRRLRGSGDVKVCSDGSAPDAAKQSCNAILQLGLAPLMVGGGGSVTAAGFGEGLGALTVVPEVGEVRALEAGGSGLADVDVALLKALQEAKRADKSTMVAPFEKARAWDKLLHYPAAKNPYWELAVMRSNGWQRVAEADARRREQVAKVCAQHRKDKAKLDELLSLDEDVVSKKQKAAYQAELSQVYAPFASALTECGKLPWNAFPAVSPPQPTVGVPDRMVQIPAGTFTMGSSSVAPDGKPKQPVPVVAFSLDVTEVTTAAYARCVSAGKCTQAGTGEFCNAGRSDKASHPINCVDWDQATAFCAWAGKRLPTEEEWEYAARGTDGRTYPWGNAEPSSQLCWNRPTQGTCEVARSPAGASPFGVLDMAGNVREWTSSSIGTDSAHIRRGGGWRFDALRAVTAVIRWGESTNGDAEVVGFRCAR